MSKLASTEVESELARQRREAQEARERSKAAERAKVIEANRAFEAAKARAGSTVSTLRDDEQDAARKNALEASKARKRAEKEAKEAEIASANRELRQRVAKASSGISHEPAF